MAFYKNTNLLKWGAGLNRALTSLEGDENIWLIWQEFVDVWAAIPAAAGIQDILVVGSQFRVQLQDGRLLGPYTMPTPTLRPRDLWLANTTYNKLDLVYVPGMGIFFVNLDHTSAATFDPTRTIDVGSPPVATLVYRNIFSLPSGPAAAPGLYISGTALSTSYAVSPGVNHSGKYLIFTSDLDVTLTVRVNSNAPFPVWDEIYIRQEGLGKINVVGETVGSTTATITGVAGYLNKSGGKGATFMLKKVADDAWHLSGGPLEVAP